VGAEEEQRGREETTSEHALENIRIPSPRRPQPPPSLSAAGAAAASRVAACRRGGAEARSRAVGKGGVGERRKQWRRRERRGGEGR
jgi:hypothetical protein